MTEEKQYGIITIPETGVRSSNYPLMAIIEIVSEKESERIMLKHGVGRRLLASSEAEEIQKSAQQRNSILLKLKSHSTPIGEKQEKTCKIKMMNRV